MSGLTQFNGQEGMANSGRMDDARLERLMYFSRCRQPHSHVLLIWKGTRSPRQGWCCLGAKVAKLSDDPGSPGCASNASVGKLGDPVCLESELGQTTRCDRLANEITALDGH